MRQIIALETNPNTGGTNNVRAVLWFPISLASARVPKAGFTSAAAGVPGGLTQTELDALADGSVLEEVVSIPYATTTTTAAIKADLIKRWTDRKDYIATVAPTRQFYGVSYDGTTWSS